MLFFLFTPTRLSFHRLRDVIRDTRTTCGNDFSNIRRHQRPRPETQITVPGISDRSRLFAAVKNRGGRRSLHVENGVHWSHCQYCVHYNFLFFKNFPQIPKRFLSKSRRNYTLLGDRLRITANTISVFADRVYCTSLCNRPFFSSKKTPCTRCRRTRVEDVCRCRNFKFPFRKYSSSRRFVSLWLLGWSYE